MGIRAALAVHPDTGRGAAARIAGTVADRLRTGVDRLELLGTASPSSLPEGLDALVVLGGDGAVHHAVQFCAATGTPLGLVPAGTGNDLARGLGVPLDPMRAVDAVLGALRERRHRSVDLGHVDGTWFATVLCTGFDAAVNARAARLTWPPGPHRYDLAVLAELAAFRARPVTLTADTEHLALDATLIAIGNTSCYGAGMRICPGADPGDGLFDITVVGHATRADLLRIMPGLRHGRHLRHPAVRTLRAREVRIEATGWPLCADGEMLSARTVTARCEPGALTVLG
ncbi:diacylglycerol/lipid kinase family protein [Amycolatopsis thermophila]|uniref:Diacylglycerol kinase (ATP) n=1 Tax=Amycolatopsis thermophila TaxID=206084 RepID=A0ABU0F2G3_9PSEU|nr:diacylglycerol kinase family protein [Amycolatopsis thermophila]MDQ0381747.1 diacylglycerol kinase (ATP) [Amycolatopsis thermophila]